MCAFLINIFNFIKGNINPTNSFSFRKLHYLDSFHFYFFLLKWVILMWLVHSFLDNFVFAENFTILYIFLRIIKETLFLWKFCEKVIIYFNFSFLLNGKTNATSLFSHRKFLFLYFSKMSKFFIPFIFL